MINGAQGKVLLVDDIKTNVSILKMALKGDYDISVAYDGETALGFGGRMGMAFVAIYP